MRSLLEMQGKPSLPWVNGVGVGTRKLYLVGLLVGLGQPAGTAQASLRDQHPFWLSEDKGLSTQVE